MTVNHRILLDENLLSLFLTHGNFTKIILEYNVSVCLGTCINNTSIMMFKKGSFEIGGTVYPVAIKVLLTTTTTVIAAATNNNTI